MKKSIVFIVFCLMFVPVFLLAQEYDYNSQTGEGSVNNNPQSRTGVVNPQPLPNAGDYDFNLETGEGNVNNNPQSGTGVVPSAPLQNSGSGQQQVPTGGSQPAPGGQTTPVVAFFLILSGFKFVVAQGNPKEIESAKQTFWYTIVGGLIIVGAQTIARILEELVKNL